MRYLIFIFLFLSALTGRSQIGYQVSLLDNATGEPRANERVEVKVKLMDSNDNVIVSETKRVTTNDLGVLSFSIGDDSTFEGFDWNNLPLFIYATVDGVLIGKSQVMTVPVAEYAKRIGDLTKEILCSRKWDHAYPSDQPQEHYYIEFNDDQTAKGTLTWDPEYYNGVDYFFGHWFISGDFVTVVWETGEGIDYYSLILSYDAHSDILLSTGFGFFK